MRGGRIHNSLDPCGLSASPTLCLVCGWWFLRQQNSVLMHHYHFRLVGIDFEEDVRGRNAGGNEELKACTMVLLTDCINPSQASHDFLILSPCGHTCWCFYPENQVWGWWYTGAGLGKRKKIGWEVKNIPLNVLFGAKYLSCNHNSLKCWHQINMEP